MPTQQTPTPAGQGQTSPTAPNRAQKSHLGSCKHQPHRGRGAAIRSQPHRPAGHRRRTWPPAAAQPPDRGRFRAHTIPDCERVEAGQHRGYPERPFICCRHGRASLSHGAIRYSDLGLGVRRAASPAARLPESGRSTGGPAGPARERFGGRQRTVRWVLTGISGSTAVHRNSRPNGCRVHHQGTHLPG